MDPHSLDQFTFEYKIEFLDAREMHLAIDEFVKMVRGRLKSGFLQQFGVLVVAVKSKDLNDAQIVLTCKHSGIGTLATFDVDFRRVPWLKVTP